MELRRNNFERYREFFESLGSKGYDIKMLKEPEGYRSNRWLSTIIIDPEHNKGITSESLRASFDNHIIETRPLWKPMHLQPIFEGTPYFGNGLSETLFKHGLCLPSGSNLTEDEAGRIFSLLESVFV
jgi:dTDP-4-amino-4,6-dideoxygalactose transaminase